MVQKNILILQYLLETPHQTNICMIKNKPANTFHPISKASALCNLFFSKYSRESLFKPAVQSFCLLLLSLRVITQTLKMSLSRHRLRHTSSLPVAHTEAYFAAVAPLFCSAKPILAKNALLPVSQRGKVDSDRFKKSGTL